MLHSTAELAQAKKSTELDAVMQMFINQNNRLADSVDKLFRIGDRLKNTNFPHDPASKVAEDSRPSGHLTDLDTQLKMMEYQNAQLEELVYKLGELI